MGWYDGIRLHTRSREEIDLVLGSMPDAIRKLPDDLLEPFADERRHAAEVLLDDLIVHGDEVRIVCSVGHTAAEGLWRRSSSRLAWTTALPGQWDLFLGALISAAGAFVFFPWSSMASGAGILNGLVFGFFAVLMVLACIGMVSSARNRAAALLEERASRAAGHIVAAGEKRLYLVSSMMSSPISYPYDSISDLEVASGSFEHRVLLHVPGTAFEFKVACEASELETLRQFVHRRTSRTRNRDAA